jgi:hypothetical protein
MPRDFLPGFNVASNMGFAKGVLLLEDCEGTFNWIVDGTGGDDVHAFATAAAFMGTNGMQLKTRATNPAEDDNLCVKKWVGFPESGLLVVRMRLCMVDVSAFGSVQLWGEVADGETAYAWEFWIMPGMGHCYYHSAAGPLVAIDGLDAMPVDASWFLVEAVLDLKAMEYVSLTVNGVRADLAGLAIVTGEAATERYNCVAITIATAGAAPCELYADHIYVGEFVSA